MVKHVFKRMDSWILRRDKKKQKQVKYSFILFSDSALSF